jgi:exodeoxyribonuclease V alpha subunit
MLQFRRYFDAEGRIAATVQRLLQLSADSGGDAFSIITGGPGTGKTTRVAELLVQLTLERPGVRVSLAAPTGKAAARLTDSIRQRLERLTAETGRRTEFPGEARTLHRLLGYSPQRDTFRATAADPLDDDLVIVDEASMVDVLLLDALLKALRPRARLMLVGDHNQLASVDAGDVLGALCRAAQVAGPGTALGDSVTWLTRSWRFAEHPAIGTLAEAILSGDADGVLRVCQDDGAGEVRMRPPAANTDALVEPVAEHLERCLAADTPAALLDALDGFRILAPEREGRLGVHGINAAVERWLARRGHAVNDLWYHGRPVLVTANDYVSGVFNGDVGVVWREQGKVGVHFRANDGSVRALAPLRLPATETAWAMTVHKAQGSEFDDVLVVIPEYDSRVMSRELLYTAATRARRSVTLVASAGGIRAAVGRSTGRTSGLEARMRETMGLDT